MTNPSLQETARRLREALDQFNRMPEWEMLTGRELIQAAEAHLQALERAQVGQFQYFGGRFWWAKDDTCMVDFINLDGKNGTLYFDPEGGT